MTPDLKSLHVSIAGNACFVFCAKCGKHKMIANGLHVHSMNRAQVLAGVKKLGWSAAPEFRCEKCKI